MYAIVTGPKQPVFLSIYYSHDIPRCRSVEQDGILLLQRLFKFKNYAQAMEFTNKIAAIAEEEDQHPLIIL
jgi:4a-hydroxytetrahydrobiopterin dehydratase